MSAQSTGNEQELRRLAFERTFNNILKQVSSECVSPTEKKRLNQAIVDAEAEVEKRKNEVTHFEELLNTMLETLNEAKANFQKTGKNHIAQELEKIIKTHKPASKEA